MTPKPAVVISFWDRRSPDKLYNLLRQIADECQSLSVPITVVVNTDKVRSISPPNTATPVSIIYRNNSGMNIGAWDHGWRSLYDKDLFVFLQDECVVKTPGWLSHYIESVQIPEVGLLGESLAWDLPWSVALDEKFKRREKYQRLHNRVSGIGIDPGDRATHIQSLVWACRRDILEKIGGFRIGKNRDECIGAEVGTSRLIVENGLELRLAGNAPFSWISHPQWDLN